VRERRKGREEGERIEREGRERDGKGERTRVGKERGKGERKGESYEGFSEN